MIQLAALGLILVGLGAIQKKAFKWKTGFWGEKASGLALRPDARGDEPGDRRHCRRSLGSSPGLRTPPEDPARRWTSRVTSLAVHIIVNPALTGATYDIDGGQQFVAA